jgi:malonate transporter and related proteins
VISAFLPIWFIVGLGWMAARTSLLGPATQQALSSFAFYFAMPAALFGMLHDSTPDGATLRPMIAFGLSTVGVGVLALGAYRWLRRDEPAEPGRLADRMLAAMASAYCNAGNLGIPIALYVLGDATLIAAVLAFQTVLITPTILAVIDGDLHAHRSRWRGVLTLPLRTPLVAASLLGFGVALAGLEIPAVVLRPVELLGGAAVPVALFALGLSLHRSEPPLGISEPVRWNRPELVLAVLFKVVGQPAVAYLIGRFGLGLDGAQLFAVTLIAGLPTAQNTFVYAAEYGRPTALIRDATLVSSVLSVASLSLIVLLLG